MKFNIIIPLATLILIGCATPYQSVGTAGGFSYSQYDEKIFEVTFSGNLYTTVDQVRDYAKLKGAELCVDSGYSYLTILKSESHSSAVITEPSGLTWESSFPSAKIKLECFETNSKNSKSYDANALSSELKKKYNL